MREVSRQRLRRLSATCLPIAAMLTVLAVGMQPALAGDRKTFPGSSCRTWGNVNAEITGTDGGAVLNASFTSAYTVSCPIVRDNTTNTNGTSDVSVYGYRDGSTTTSLSCIFKVTSASVGTDYYSLSRATSLTGNIMLTIPVTTSQSGAFYNMLCILPPRSKIYGYIVPEY
jgi:hypothetical protein